MTTIPLPRKVCGPGDFPFAASHLEHPHIGDMCARLVEAGGELRYVYDPDDGAVEAFRRKFPGVRRVHVFEQIFDDDQIRMIACAAVNSRRGDIGVQVMRAGCDFFCDKPLFTEPEQIVAARLVARETGRKYMGYFGERLCVECAVRAGEFIAEGRIGRVVQVLGLGPHRLNAPARPDWFFDMQRAGGIICDIGSHQIEQFLFYTGTRDATVTASRVANYRNKNRPGFQDFGEVSLLGDNGAVGYFRLDWLTPDALDTWGDGRVFVLGTNGYIEMRKYTDLGGAKGQRDNLFLVNDTVNERHNLHGTVGLPFFGELIMDCLNRTEKAMSQEHVFKTSELAVQAQKQAVVIE